MKNFQILILIFFSVTYVDGQTTPQQMVSKMGRGINMGNVMSAPVEGNWAPAFTESYFQDVASAGFKTVRIPIDFFGTRTSGDTSGYSKAAGTSASYTGTPADYIVNAAYLDRVEQVINWGLNQNLVVVLDFHGSTLKDEFLHTFSPKAKWSAFYTEPTSAKRAADNEKFRAIWTQIAERFKNYSFDLLFEVVNEPYFFLTGSEMDILNTDIINIIRNSGSNNSDRNIIITGGGENSYEAPLQIGDAIINNDDNLIATFHYYWPRAFTASAGENDNDYDWGTAADKLEIDTDFQAVKDWSTSKSIPVLLGEFGADNVCGFNYNTGECGDFGGPDEVSRVAFHSYLAEKAINLGFCFTAWDAGHKSGKTIYIVSTGNWVDSVRDALLGVPTTCSNSGIINNADIECGFDSDWELTIQSGAATSSNADLPNSYNASTSMEVDVSTAGTALNSIIIKNQNVDATSLVGTNLMFTGYAKASGASQSIRVRLRVEDNVGATSFPGKTVALSNTDYNKWAYDYNVPENTAFLQFQVLCGATDGTYYFDDFLMEEETLSINAVSTKNLKAILYPNPAKDVVYVKTEKHIKTAELFNITGQKKLINVIDKSLDLSDFPYGFYLLQLNYFDGSSTINKLLINH